MSAMVVLFWGQMSEGWGQMSHQACREAGGRGRLLRLVMSRHKRGPVSADDDQWSDSCRRRRRRRCCCCCCCSSHLPRNLAGARPISPPLPSPLYSSPHPGVLASVIRRPRVTGRRTDGLREAGLMVIVCAVVERRSTRDTTGDLGVAIMLHCRHQRRATNFRNGGLYYTSYSDTAVAR